MPLHEGQPTKKKRLTAEEAEEYNNHLKRATQGDDELLKSIHEVHHSEAARDHWRAKWLPKSS